MDLTLFNTMSRKAEVFHPLEGDEVRMYTCGPTVYNYAHIGNFRAYVFEDLLHRVLKYFNYKVTQVMNLTDVDDKTIRDSRAAGLPLRTFTAKYIEAFFADRDVLNITPAAVYPAATDHIEEMQQLIATLLEKGYAYQAADKSIYFSIDKFPEYGKLAHIDRENQRSGVRIKNDEYAKDAAADFALWKAWDENDGDVAWDSPWGKGRPGWHIECSAMAMKYLGKTFDIHTGGVDNMFPHHEDEIAQSECANGCAYVKYWLHCAHLMVNGEKMSKSAGNFYTLRDLQNMGWSGREIRQVLLGTHYRKKLNFTFDALKLAREQLRKFDDLFRRLQQIAGAGEVDAETAQLAQNAENEFTRAMGDDLNVSGGWAAVFGLQRSANALADQGKLSPGGARRILEVFEKIDTVFGVLEPMSEKPEEKSDVPPEMLALAERRVAARKAKDYALADQLRDELRAAGWAMEDCPGGAWKLKPVE